MEHEQHTDKTDVQATLEKLRRSPKNNAHQYTTAIYILFTCVALVGVVTVYMLASSDSVTKTDASETSDSFVKIDNPFDSISLISNKVVVWDIENQNIIYSKNETESHPLASVSKLMTIYTAQEHATNILSVTIGSEDIALEGDQGLLQGEVWRLSDLIDYSMVTSSNDGMSAIAAEVGKREIPYGTHEQRKQAFIKLMNDEAQKLGLTSMRFLNESGLDDEIQMQAKGFGSALDVAHLIEKLMRTYPRSIESTREKTIETTSTSGFLHAGNNTNLSTSKIPGLLVSKTGFTDLAGGNLAIAFDASLNRPIIIVVLGSTREGRFTDVETLVEKTRLYIKEYESTQHLETATSR